MRKIEVNSFITVTLTEETYRKMEEEKREQYENWLAEQEMEEMAYYYAMAGQLRKLRRRLEAATTKAEYQQLWDVYSDMHKDFYGVRP